MADQKISQLTALTGANTAADDVLAIVDTNAAETKKITVDEFQKAPLSSGTVSGVPYLNGSKVLTTGSALTFDGTKFTVGVGSTFSDAIADFYQDTNATRYVYARNPNAGGSAGITFNASAGGGGDLRMSAYGAGHSTLANHTSLYNHKLNGALLFGVNGTEQMRLTSTGLGIGTSSPDAKLDVVGIGLNAVFGSENLNNSYIAFKHNSVNIGYIGNGSAVNSGSGSTDFGIGSPGTRSLTFGTNDTERMRIDSSGNLGLGVTPSAWNTSYKSLDNYKASFGSTSNTMFVGNNWYVPSGNTNIYKTTDAATLYTQAGGIHAWLNAPSGTAGDTFTFTQAMTLDASGNLAVGSTTSRGRIGSTLSDATTTFSSLGYGMLNLMNSSATNNNYSWMTFAESNGNYVGAIGTLNEVHGAGSATVVGSLVFATKQSGVGGFPVERARITAAGELLIGTTTDNGAYLLQVNSQIWATNATIATSDSRLKENVAPITNALETIGKVQAVAFDFKQDTDYNFDAERQTGFIAQDLQTALADTDYKDSVVKECGPYLGVAYEKMIPILTAAIQELKAELDSVKAELNQIKGA